MNLFFKVLREARGLRSEDNQNPEYDSALVELSCRILDISTNDGAWDDVRELILDG